MKNGGTTPFKTVTNAKLDTMYAQVSTTGKGKGKGEEEVKVEANASNATNATNVTKAATPANNQADKAASLKEHLQTIAASEAFQAAHLANHTKSMEDADKKAKTTFDTNHKEILETMEFN
jgi:hypothetical protein